jgi:hypothetical protein
MQPITDPLTLDPRQLFEGEAKIHLFSTEFVREQKTECFIVSKLIDFIVENKQKYFNGKVLVVFDEAPELFGSKQSRLFYKKQLAGKFSKFLRQSARIRGISTLSATHSLSGLNRTLLKDNCFNWLKVGQTSSKYDLEILRDFFGFGMDHMRALQSLQKGVFLGIKIPGVSLQQSSYQGLRTIPARFRHAQEDENYEKEYAKEFKKRMQNYHFIVSLLKDIEKEERKKIEQQIKTMQNKVIKEDEQGGNKE